VKSSVVVVVVVVVAMAMAVRSAPENDGTA
jgi:hypothetical protein